MADNDNNKKPSKMSLADFLLSFPTGKTLLVIYIGFLIEYIITMGLLIFYLKNR